MWTVIGAIFGVTITVIFGVCGVIGGNNKEKK